MKKYQLNRLEYLKTNLVWFRFINLKPKNSTKKIKNQIKKKLNQIKIKSKKKTI
jgi:hypothetical protein